MCSGKAANEGVVRTESERVEVDKWFIGGGIELNPNSPHSSSDLCALVSDGDDEEEGLCECERGEVKDHDLVEGNTVYGVWRHVSRVHEKGIRMGIPSTRMMTASVLGSCGTVGAAGRVLDWEVQYLWGCSYWMASKTRNGGSTNDAHLVVISFFRQPRNLTSKPENRPTTPSQ